MSSNQSRYPIKHASSVKIIALKKKSTTASLNKGSQTRWNNDSETIKMTPTNYEIGPSKVAGKDENIRGSHCSQKTVNSCLYSQKTGNMCPPLHKTEQSCPSLQKTGSAFSQFSRTNEHHYQSPKIVVDGSSDKKRQSK